MDAERRLELIALLAKDEAWEALKLIGTELLDSYYPASVFTGSSGEPGPMYVRLLREALARIENDPPRRL